MSSRIFSIVLFAACIAFCPAAIFGQTSGSSGVAVGEPRTVPHSTSYLVFPFENESRVASLNWMGEGLSELTVERLQDRNLMVFSRQDRLATLEKIGLPDSARFSHATLIRIATEADADVVIYGRFISDGKTATLEAHVMHISPPSLSPPLTETAPVQELLRAHARLSWQILCEVDRKNCLSESANKDETTFTDPPPSLRLDAFENFVRGMTGPDDETRLRLLREASKLEPTWNRPPFALGQIYFERRDCESALPWLSRVPPNRPEGIEAGFDTGVCHLLRNDAARAEVAFAGLIERVREADAKERAPEFPELHNNLGISRLRLAKYVEAETEFERAAALDEDEPNYWVNLGIAKLAGKQPAAAVTPFERARKLDPDDKEARLLLIATLESLGRSSEAAAVRAEVSEMPNRATASSGQANAGGNSQSGSQPTAQSNTQIGSQSSSQAGGQPNAQPNNQSSAGINLQDPTALARLARVSKDLDRGFLRPASVAPTSRTPAEKRPRKNESNSNGEMR